MELSQGDLSAYLARIGYGGPLTPTLGVLRDLQYRHAMTLPFENLDVLLGRPIRLDPASLVVKLVAGGRGGYCFEQNGLFMRVLTALGFAVTPLAARVRLNVPDDVMTARTHMLLKVDLSEGPYIVDVGFGGLNPTAPFALICDRQQETVLETYRVVAHGAGFELQARLGAAWTPLYRFNQDPQAPADYDMANWFVSTSPNSRFVRNLTLARPGAGHRTTLLNDRLTIRRRDGTVEERAIAGLDDRIDVLARHFDLDLLAIAGDGGARSIVERYFPGG